MLKLKIIFLIMIIFGGLGVSVDAQAGGVVSSFAKEVLKEVAKGIIVEVIKDFGKSAQIPLFTSTADVDVNRVSNILTELNNTHSSHEERIGLYAVNVDYFKAGIVNHDFIIRGWRYFESRWPIRRYEIKSIDEIVIPPDRKYAIVRYTVKFYVERNGDYKSGISNVYVVIGSFNSQPRIHAIKEWVHHDHK